MTQDKNHFFIKAFRAVLVATMMLLTGGNALAQVTVKGSVYGGGNEADVQTNTEVNISYGTVEGNVYGGGNLGDVGRIDKTDASYNYKWTVDESGNTTENYNNTGVCNVNITGGTIGTTGSGNGYVFGGGKGDNSTFWCEKGMVYSTNVSISKGTVYGNVYGGGEVGRVESNTIVTIGPDSGDDEPEIKGSVFGAGKGLDTHGYSALVRGNPVVTIQGKAKISGTLDNDNKLVEGTGNVYGGGEIASVGKHKVKTPANANEEGTPQNLPLGMPWTLANTNLGICTVNVKGNATIAGNVYGAGKGIEPVDFASANPKPGRMGMTEWETFETNAAYLVYVHTLALTTDTHVTISGEPTISGSVYGGSENGFVQYHSNVTIAGGAVGNNVYGGGRGLATFDDAGQVSGNVNVSVSGGSVGNDVFGGGELGFVKKGVTVNITGGTVTHNVYGGGALADTNTENWDASTGTWRVGWTSAENTTTVNLKGGTIGGDAYGGGLGRLAKAAVAAQDAQGTEGEEGYVPAVEAQPAVTAVEAMVYGDVFVNQGKANDDEAPATAYTITYLTDDNSKQVVNSGRIFGCNNLNGSPKGNVTVTVNRTVKGNVERTEITRDATTHQVTNVAFPHTYEVAAVYGGGNLANYTPKDGKTQVIINSCDVSIEEVYGGGNAAKVPSTDVTVNGAHEIERVFGGGNGKDKYTLDGGTTWNVNQGADVNGYTNTLIKGGYVHEAYGGSNEKGTITGNITIDTGSGGCTGCPVKLDKLVGAGKNADVTGNRIYILGCKNTEIPEFYAGADNANLIGDVEVTITSGRFGKVFGGNNLGGAIFGHIILNIEETSTCDPIIINELYLGGNQASYSRYGYYKTGVGANGNPLYMPRTSATDTHKPYNLDGTECANISEFTPYDEPVLNVISCTSIGEVFGGGYGVGGDMYANPIVNINMIPGSHASSEHALGTIGNVYGGGNAADVAGNTTVNIGTATTVNVKSWNYDSSTDTYTAEERTVEGANITGNVYGGGKLADVGKTHTETVGQATSDIIDAVGNTYVNIGTKYNTTTEKWDAVAEGVSMVLIAGNVFGGGKGEAATAVSGSFRCGKAMVTGGTNVHIGNGKIGTLDANGKLVAETGNVYGGGEVGRVEKDPVVMIGVESGTTAPIIEGEVYGAGKGVRTHGYSALVRGNTTVTVQGDAKVRGSVYGGGEIGSVGRYNVATPADLAAHPDVLVGMPFSLANNGSGYCTVIVRGNAEIGPKDEMLMTRDGGPDDTGYVFGGGKGVMPFEGYAVNEKPWRVLPTNEKEFFSAEGYEEYYGANYKEEGHDYEVDYFRFIETLALATQTNVTISGNAFVKGSVYGGSFNGRVQHDTHVTIEGGQIGAGENVYRRYTDAEWASSSLAECPHWAFDVNSGAPYDKYATKLIDGKYYYDVKDDDNNYIYAEGGSSVAKDGHTYYGNVFGGGSGSIPYAPGKWHRGAGAVGGDTYVNITGGHVLTSVYGGNEMTDVGAYTKDTNGQNTTTPVATDAKGKCTVNITGGTVGVPRTDAEKVLHPVVGNVFGAGKGDQRIFFNTWTNVISTEVNISGNARIYGSVFGGGEDGHIMGDAETNIGGNAIIGTTGTSYYDGNVFGGGRGFSGDAQTAGTVGGNVRLNINAGNIYGSVYGGGRLASVGTMFEFPTLDDGSPNPAYGNFKEDGSGKTYGHITVDISGGTIGNAAATGDGAKYSGNVFGGSMGRLELLNGTRNPIWPKMAQVKSATVNISGDNTVIRRSVYGGGELGTVRDDAEVTISGGTVRRDVYGGGYGSEDRTYTIFSVYEPNSTNTGYNENTYAFTPMQFAGCVGKSTTVNVSGGYIRKSAYGGGELASVGIYDCQVKEVDAVTAADVVVKEATSTSKAVVYSNMSKHSDAGSEFALSWPYKFNYFPIYPGATHVNITGGRLGLKDGDTDTGFEDNGDVYGAGKGKAGDNNDYLFCANVGSTDVKIAYTSTPEAYTGNGDLIAGAVYGGGEDGHVMGDTKLTISGGLIYHSVYGGGSGKGKISRKLLKSGKTYGSTNEADYETRDAYSITAGKVFGNTEVNMSGGFVVRNIYGGGNMGSVGKGNYAGGTGDYNTAGYGEKVTDLWSNADFLGSGKCTVKISGGIIGYIASDPKESMYPYDSPASLPYGNVFGGCRGEAVPNITDSPRYYYCPEFFVGYANETSVEIGNSDGTGPTIKGSIYGGGMDGHVRRDASVTIKGGVIGMPFTDANKQLLGGLTITDNTTNKVSDNIQWLARGNVYGAGSGIGKYNNESCTSAGSVTRFTTVDIQGGTIYRNVYGGGSLASIGAPKIPADRTDNPTKAQTLNQVTISGGQIGDANSYDANGNYVYGGRVFGGSRGDATLDATKFSTSMFTSVSINATNSPVIYGSVFGGGEVGIVKGGVDVTMNGGTVNHDVYGGGALANTNTENTTAVPYITTVNLYGGQIKGDAYGGGLGQLEEKTGETIVKSAIEAKVYGNVFVNLGDDGRNGATAFEVNKFTEGTHAGIVKSGRVFGCNNLNGSPQGSVTVTVNKTVKGNTEKTASDDLKSEDDTKHSYHVAAVYGGGNLAGKTVGGSTNVIINGCDVSIRDVYGGGNAAEVPATDVLVNGAYEIGEVFGGGNGKDDYTLDGGTTWTPNPGANINGNTNTLLLGGLIHEAYGGSNEKGTITGSVVINTGEGQPEYCSECPLDVEKLVGAGKNADVNGDLIMVLGCKPSTKTPLVYGGADNANVNGNVELTITSGSFGKVFGGNNRGGIIKGHILLNIEETGCNPINIDELYLGGNEAAYSIYGYYQDGTDTSGKPIYKPRTAAMHAITDTSDENYKAPVENPADDATHSFPYAQPVLNVVSCTSIGKVFGGGYGVGGAMYADPTVNINMIQGRHAANITATADNPNQLGAIGDVYGGGNAADVIGNPTVNIGTVSTVQLHESYNATTRQYAMSGDKEVKGAYITGNVFGAGKGEATTFTCEKAMVGIDGDGVNNPIGGTTVNIYNGTVVGNVYGGGEVGRVEKNTAVTIGTGDGVDATTNTPTSAPVIKGSVFGGGKGVETHGYSALVRGNPTVTVQGNAKVRGNVYGGGQIASVARYKVAASDDEGAPYGVKKDMPYALKNNNSGFCTVTIQGYAEIGPEDGSIDGNVFGAGKGILPGGAYAFVQETTKRMSNVNGPNTWETFADEAAYITFVKTLALASQTNVTIDGNAKVKGSVYGGSESGFVQFDTNVNVVGGTIGTQGKGGADFGNVYGGGKGDVEYTGTNHDYITAGIVKGNTKVAISQASGKTTKIYHNVYGGGAYGTVGEFEYNATTGLPTARKTYKVGTEVHNTTGGQTEVYITGGEIGTNGKENGMIFGSSRGDVGAPGSIHDKAAWVYDTHVAIGDTTATTTTTATPLIKGSVYGGGENGHNFHNAYVRINGGTIGISSGETITDNNGTPDDTTDDITYSGAAYPYRGNVYGGGCGTDKYYATGTELHDGNGDTYNAKAGIVQGNAIVHITAGTVVHNVYGAGAMGSVGITNADGTITGGQTTINISGGTIGVDGTAGEGNVFGAARGDLDDRTAGLAEVRETEVNIKPNAVEGISAADIKGSVYGGGEAGTVKGDVNVNMTGGTVGHDVYGGGALADTQTSNWDATKNSGAGGWAEGKVNDGMTTYKTIVNLLGGTIKGDAYGGGLGQLGTNPIEAKVYGDVNVTLNGSAFNISYYGGDHSDVVKSGRLFGSNNLNGSPQGNVTVTVNKTVKGNVGRTAEDPDNPGRAKKGVTSTYELAAVYGGGNLADYTPALTGAKTNVNIMTCDVSIQEVYGGGNAAAVPETDVLVNGAYEIEYVFGGGNGEDPYTLDGGTTWIANKGANIGLSTIGDVTYGSGNTNTLLKGGYIHEAYGGSNVLGTIKGTVVINAGSGGDCTLDCQKIVAAGRNANLDGDAILIMGCVDGAKVDQVIGGADNANVNGNVELTITSGTFGKVFGGNNLGGVIKGHIKLNIEETNCTPIKIDELYLGGNEAAYSIYGYYDSGETDSNGKPIYLPRTSENDEHTAIENPATDATHSFPYADPELNIISCTYIGKVFGGGLGQKAIMYANPTVNINMIPGVHAGGVPTLMTSMQLDPTENPDKLGIIGDVYGGGNEADVIGNPTVNIGTAETVTMTSVDDDTNTADIDEKHPKVKGAYITGNVFGGGMGSDDTFTCEKAMVGKDGDGVDHPDGGTNVTIGNGTVNGNVYGGGEIARVEKNTMVTIGLGDGVATGTPTSAPIIKGHVFGGGKGKETHGYSALVRGNPTVIVQGNAKVRGSVYGGGEIASVARYNVAKTAEEAAANGVSVGMPYALANNTSGNCIVRIGGYAEIGPEYSMSMVTTGGKPDDAGHVFGAGQGILPKATYTYADNAHRPKRMVLYNQDVYTTSNQAYWEYVDPSDPDNKNIWEYFADEDTYIAFIQTLALASQTDVTISGNAFVKGSVFGGSENGLVQYNTHVTIDGDCQIGCGEGKTAPYSTSDWTSEDPSLFTECSHWPYEAPYAPWDLYDFQADGKTPKPATDGHTFYGNVFGGGSGYYPYKEGPALTSEQIALGYSKGVWLRSAGVVKGNTVVDIKGGHILTSVYGGNEQTDVLGSCTINMSGGTLGVPRTVEQMKAHPLTCYLFGAGRGDQRINFNTWTNVASTKVNITGGRIFGSVFGGGEDGHVLGDVTMNISGNTTKIGTTGTSYVDGNIFGGGRGFSGDAQTAGTVGGNITMTISGGEMLGSVYGGGRLASVGTLFTQPEAPNYGNFVEDGVDGKTYGHVTINISGGTIGNSVGNDVSGNVFGGSMGRLELLNGMTNPIWPKMAQVKETNVNISGSAIIKRSVFGGGELGTVRDNAHVTISGGTVNRDVYGGGYGSEDDDTHTIFTVKEPKPGVENPSSADDYNDNTYAFTPMQFAGCVGGSTTVNISGGYVRKSVYGGGEMASVGVMNCLVEEESQPGKDKIVVGKNGSNSIVYQNMRKHWDETKEFALSWPIEFSYIPGFEGATHVNITGGRIGTTTADDYGTDNGDVYGGGKGFAGDYNDYVFCANVGSTEVNIDYKSGNTTLDPANYLSGGDCIAGAVYGGGENGHVMGDTKVTLKNGLIGHALYGGGSGKGTFLQKLLKIGKAVGSTNEADYYTREIYSITAGKVFGNTTVDMSGGYVVRNVYGGGTMGSVGKGNYAGGNDDYSAAGYGEKAGGNLWDGVSDNSKAFLNSGLCTVKITGGTVGYTGIKDGLPYGNVFGGCRGESAPNIVESPRYLYSPEFFVGYANETNVIIGTEGSTTGPRIFGSVYGGGQDGHVRRDATVTINSGEIGKAFTGTTADLNDAEWLFSGNVFGAGSGIGKYKYDFDYDGKYDHTVPYNNGRATVDTKEEDYSTSAGSVTRFTTVTINGGTIHRNVYGGGSLSTVGAPKIPPISIDPYRKDDASGSQGQQSLNQVNIAGGQIGDATSFAAGYGGHVFGASRGDATLENPASYATAVWTDVNMKGGTVLGDVYGGGEVGSVRQGTEVMLTGGTVTHDVYGGGKGTSTVAANVGGDVLVDLNGNIDPTKKGAVVKGNIFGANNINGTPKGHVLVYVHGTQNENTAAINAKVDGKYDVVGVYGGGNQADYVPTDATQSTEVIIEGCDLTSIDEVYGGGYGAATPATSVLVKGTKIINNVYGGGYGAGATNPGANVGYLTGGTAYTSGTGKAIVQLMAGTINNVYGGSNTKGDIRGGSSVTNVANTHEAGCCDKLTVGEIYGGGKQADMYGGAEIVLGCMPNDWIGAIYAGAENADIGGDVGLTLTSGKFERVFGGNNKGGKIDGYIEVNIEENPNCETPIIIGGLYGGGNMAPYTVPAKYTANNPNYQSPRVNVRAFTSIGNIYGGGFGADATVTGNPLVNINQVEGGREYAGETKDLEDGSKVTLFARSKDGKMGVIGNVFGGGNAAKVIGNTTVNIGTESEQQMVSLQTTDEAGNVTVVKKPVVGADIRGNVYGGGNNAAVVGKTDVVIGKKK